LIPNTSNPIHIEIHQKLEMEKAQQIRSEIVSGISICIEIQNGTFRKSRTTLFLLNINKYLKYLFIFYFSFSFSFLSSPGNGKEGEVS
jgi:hypothetical protein